MSSGSFAIYHDNLWRCCSGQNVMFYPKNISNPLTTAGLKKISFCRNYISFEIRLTPTLVHRHRHQYVQLLNTTQQSNGTSMAKGQNHSKRIFPPFPVHWRERTYVEPFIILVPKIAINFKTIGDPLRWLLNINIIKRFEYCEVEERRRGGEI